MKRTDKPTTARRLACLGAFCVAVPLLIPAAWYLPGAAFWLLSLGLALTDPDPAFRRRLGVLLAMIAVLTVTPIETDTSNRGFLVLGGAFLAVILIPALILGRTDPGVITYRVLPRRFRWLDILYVAISIPLAWGAITLYFHLNPWMPTHWNLPPVEDPEQTWRLFIGINGVGIWDELFFVNTVFAVLRSVFPFRVANVGQMVVYASVLYDMAFTGWGVVFVPLFAWTQGSMFEESDNLLYVITVHLIVDYFLFNAIASYYYPGFNFGFH